jgi:hypothetical protein
MKLLLEFFSKINRVHKPLPLGRWSSVNSNHDILLIKYKLKKQRQKLKENNIDPYILNKKKLDQKESLVSNYPFIDW